MRQLECIFGTERTGSWELEDSSLASAKPGDNLLDTDKYARGTGPYVPMTAETVANRTYPLVRDAYVYVNRTPGRAMDPKVKEFLRFVLSREGQEIIANTDMYYPLTAAALSEQLKRLE